MASLAFVHFRGARFSLALWSLLRFARMGLIAVLALLALSGCVAPPPPRFGPTLDSPNVKRVCVRQPNVPKNKQWWALTRGGNLMLEDWEIALAQEHGFSVYYFDPFAPPESARSLPIPYHTLECPPPPPKVLPPRTLPLKRDVEAKEADEKMKAAAKAAEVKKAEEAKAAEAKKAEAKRSPSPPPPRREQAQPIAKAQASPKPPPSPKPPSSRPLRVVESAGCKEISEAGQRRLPRSTGTRTCVRTRTLKPPSEREDPEQAKAPRESSPVALALPEPKLAGTKENAEQPFGDWPVDEPDTSGLTPDRAIECLEQLCHKRHPSFIKESNDKKGGSQKGYAKVGEEGGGKAPPKTRTTVKTRKNPLSKESKGGGAGPKKPGDGGFAPGKKPTGAPAVRKPQQPDLSKWKEKGGTVRDNPDGSRTFQRKDGVEVTFDKDGFPDFSKHRHPQVKDVQIEFTGSRPRDDRLANAAAGLSEKPVGYTWHHHQDGRTMQLIKSDVHGDFYHTGGMSTTR